MDATIPEIGTAARYILMEIDEPGEEGAGGAATLRGILGGLKLRIDAYCPEGGKLTRVSH